jgi:molybdopterin converting factor subunit 1
VLYFASARDVVGVASETMDVPTSLGELTDILTSKYGTELRKILDHSLYAVNMDYVEKSAEVNVMLKDKDEIAIIPPVSGG